MKHEKEFFLKIIAAVALIAVAALVYGTLAIQSADARLDTQGIILKSLNAGGSQQGQAQAELAEISTIIIQDSSKPELISLQPLVEQLKTLQGAEVISEKSLEKDSAEAIELITKYNIDKLPAVLVQGETAKVETLAQNWSRLGSVEDDNTMVFRNVPPIYLELSTGNLRGEARAIYIAVPDKNEVFLASLYKQILANAFGIQLVDEKTIDYNSSAGEALLAKYSINALPTILLSGDLQAYTGFQEAWLQAGSIENDGNFIFRNLGLLQGLKYLDLNKGEVVEALAPVQG